jgi:flagellar export protein FliJ
VKIDDVKTLWAIRRHAADRAAQQLAQADAQRADAERRLAMFRAQVDDEAQRAHGLDLSQALAPWCRAAAGRLRDLETSAVAHTDQAAAARESLRAATTEAERLGTVSEQLETQRRIETARQAQARMDELGLRRRSGR